MTKIAIDQWASAAGISSGMVFRSMNNRGQLAGKPLLAQNIMEAVHKYGRRSLGHASIVTTEKIPPTRIGVARTLRFRRPPRLCRALRPASMTSARK